MDDLGALVWKLVQERTDALYFLGLWHSAQHAQVELLGDLLVLLHPDKAIDQMALVGFEPRLVTRVVLDHQCLIDGREKGILRSTSGGGKLCDDEVFDGFPHIPGQGSAERLIVFFGIL